ncbi:MAG: hypothetical protein WCR27_08210 [Eubacteriales bacterium]
MDFFTIVIIGVVIYFFTSKGEKNAPPKRYQTNPQRSEEIEPFEGKNINTEKEKKPGGILEQLGKQLTEYTKQIEESNKPERKAAVPQNARNNKRKSKDPERAARNVDGQEGAWGDEGRSSETEGNWGTEGAYYAQKAAQKKNKSVSYDSGEASDKSISQETLPALNFTSEGVAQGLIWTEILGEPRGRKPFRSRRTI